VVVRRREGKTARISFYLMRLELAFQVYVIPVFATLVALVALIVHH
jgi:hypothetical protein